MEPLNGFAQNSYGRRVWSLARTSLKVKVKGQETKNVIFRPSRRPACALRLVKHLSPLVFILSFLGYYFFERNVSLRSCACSTDDRSLTIIIAVSVAVAGAVLIVVAIVCASWLASSRRSSPRPPRVSSTPAAVFRKPAMRPRPSQAFYSRY